MEVFDIGTKEKKVINKDIIAYCKTGSDDGFTVIEFKKCCVPDCLYQNIITNESLAVFSRRLHNREFHCNNHG